ncbi:MAG: NAD(P)-dependent oxidoreductase [Solirubrobacterales bacterium]|nr:NAD(P)-dependent oxidoreductase [Solirubrobacterales bacterium]MCB8970323.1 NAD(P)-dependent oxidoreductase [Thermoleophilales bacterium]MCO5325486.1 NAD(P)-dependent oxidoreductase [Solirubrobacterales bacterium]
MSVVSANGRTVCVIGGAGYVGNVLTRRLLGAGYHVRVLDRLIFDHGAAIAPLLEHPRFELIVGDLRDPAAVDRALAGATDVALLAGLVGDPITATYRELSDSINRDGCKAVVESLDGRGLDRLVFTSTCSNYGLRTSDEPATEESELAPVSLYAEHKVELERKILAEAQRGVDYTPTVLRISTAYGLSPRMRFDLTISEFTRTLAAGLELVVYDADTWRPYCHVSDISKAVMTALEASAADVSGEVFNVGHSDENYTKRMVVDVVQDAIGGTGKVTFEEGGRDPRNYRVNFDKIRDRLGYQPDVRVPQSVAAVAQAVQAGAYDDFDQRQSFYTNHTISDSALGTHPAAEGEG